MYARVRRVCCNLSSGICITFHVLQTLFETLQSPRKLSTARLTQNASDLIRRRTDQSNQLGTKRVERWQGGDIVDSRRLEYPPFDQRAHDHQLWGGGRFDALHPAAGDEIRIIRGWLF